MSEPLKLNIGCGPLRFPGEIGIDKFPTEASDLVLDFLDGLPYEDNSVDQVRFEHILEHLPFRPAPRAIFEIYRVLKPGGVLLLGVPDLLKTAFAFLEASSLQEKILLIRQVYGSQAHPGEYHQSGWDPEMITHLLSSFGFISILVSPDTTKDQWGASLSVTAIKPESSE